MNENRFNGWPNRHKIIGGEWMKKTFSGLILWGRMNETVSMDSQTGIKSLGANGWKRPFQVYILGANE